jgi:hypothetical protein
MTYDPNSTDAMFSRVLNRLDTQDDTLKQILAEVKKTNGRVTKIETENAITKGKVAAVSALVSGVVAIIGWVWTNK